MTEPQGAATFHAPAQAYDRFVGRYGAELARALVRTGRVERGHRALDVGCGPGALTKELVAILGSEHVAAVEPSETFAGACRIRNPGVEVVVAPAEAIPFGDDEFDRVLAQLVVNFMTDPRAGVHEMRRVTRPGGTVSAAVWDYSGEMTLLRRFWDAAVALDPDAAVRDEGRCMPYCTADELAALWSETGLLDVDIGAVTVTADYENYEELWLPLETGVGPAGAYVASLPPDGRAALKAQLSARLEIDEEPFALTARAFLVTGRAG